MNHIIKFAVAEQAVRERTGYIHGNLLCGR